MVRRVLVRLPRATRRGGGVGDARAGARTAGLHFPTAPDDNYLDTVKVNSYHPAIRSSGSFQVVRNNRITRDSGHMDLNNIVSQAAAARMLGITRQAVASLINRGRLKTVRVDGVPYVYRSSVEGFQKRKPGPKPKA